MVLPHENPFTHVRPRKKRNRKPRSALVSPSEMLVQVRKELLVGDWMSDCQSIVRDCFDKLSFTASGVLCLGLGSPCNFRDARAQLAFLLQVCDDLGIGYANVSAFDPAFSEEDRRLLSELKVRCLTENQHAKHTIQTPTVVFMPHCDMHLYENILRQNWSKDCLQNILLIGNRLSDYVDNNPSRKLVTDFPYILRLVPYLDTRPLPESHAFSTAFNNTAAQRLRLEALLALSEDAQSAFWEVESLEDCPNVSPS